MATTSATNSERADNNNDDNKKKDEGEDAKKFQPSSTTDSQGDKTKEPGNDLNQIGKNDTLSSTQSTSENNKSDQPSSSDSNTERKKVESELKSDVSPSTTDIKIKTEETKTNSNKDEDSHKEKSTTVSTSSTETKKEESITSAENVFSIKKGDAQHLTDFQRKKAKYFFNVNLDIENKEHVTWDDVEFYLLFHATTAGKEGSDASGLEGRLSRAARAFWEHVHDQIPLPDKKRDTLTLDQFLDTWGSLVSYVVRTNQLPPVVQDLVKLGFELYSTVDDETKSGTIQPTAFDQLFQKMNLGRPYAIMAFKYLTENGTKPLDADKIESLVKAVITSSDDEHDSHFLLPGFFKTIANDKNKNNKPPSPSIDKGQTESNGKSTPTSPTPSSQPKAPISSSSQPNAPSPPSAKDSQKPNQPPPTSSQTQQQNGPSSSSEKPPGSASQNGIIRPPPANQQHLTLQNHTIQQEDENIRRLLRYYHIDDGDIVEVATGSAPRLIRVHPERPLPPYIQQNKQLLNKLQADSANSSSVQQNGPATSPTAPNNNEKPPPSPTETTPKVTLEERVSRGEAQKGPTVPLHQEQKQENAPPTGVRQVYPQLNEAQQEEQQKQAKLQATQPVNDEKQTTEETTTTKTESSSKETETKEKKDLSPEEEEKIVAAVLKQLTPIVEKRVAAELRRLQSGKTDQDEDDDFIPFPFMFAGPSPFYSASRGGPPPQGPNQQQHSSQQNGENQGQQHQAFDPRGAGYGGMPGGAAIFPPELIMAMMSDLQRASMGGGEMPGYPPNMAPPHRGPGGAPTGVEGFMMFVDDDQMMGGPPGYPPRSGPRF